MTTLVRSIPGLDAPLTRNDLLASAKLYDSLRDDDDLPPDLLEPPPYFGTLFASFGVQNKFGVHLVHSHGKAPKGTVIHGDIGDSGPVHHWAGPTPIDKLDLQAMHGRLFAVTRDRKLQAYEFQAGAPSDYAGLDLYIFLGEFVKYVVDNELWDLALEVLEPRINYATPLYEVLIGSPHDDGLGRAMVSEATLSALGGIQSRTTGWHCVERNGVVELKGNQHHTSEDGKHIIYYDGKLAKNPREAEEVLKLRQTPGGQAGRPAS